VSNAAFVLIAVAVIIVVSVLLWLLNRKPQTFMSSIDDFEREMKALGGEAARGGAGRQRRRAIAPSSRRPSTGERTEPTFEPPREPPGSTGEPTDSTGQPTDSTGEPAGSVSPTMPIPSNGSARPNDAPAPNATTTPSNPIGPTGPGPEPAGTSGEPQP